MPAGSASPRLLPPKGEHSFQDAGTYPALDLGERDLQDDAPYKQQKVGNTSVVRTVPGLREYALGASSQQPGESWAHAAFLSLEVRVVRIPG